MFRLAASERFAQPDRVAGDSLGRSICVELMRGTQRQTICSAIGRPLWSGIGKYIYCLCLLLAEKAIFIWSLLFGPEKR